MSRLSMASISPYGKRLRRQRWMPSPSGCHASGKRALCGPQQTAPRSKTHDPVQAPVLRTSGSPDRVRSRQSRETGPSSPVFSDKIVQVLDRKLTAPISGQAVTRLPRPHLIDSGIGTIQAGEQVLDQRDPVLRRQSTRLLRSASWHCRSFSFLCRTTVRRKRNTPALPRNALYWYFTVPCMPYPAPDRRPRGSGLASPPPSSRLSR
jgi:hypothetical protein